MTARHFAEKGLIRRFVVVRPSQARVHKPRRYRPRLGLHVPYLQRTGRQWCLRPQCRKHVSNPCLWHCRDIAMRQGFFSSITVSSHRPTAVYLVHCWPKRHYAAQDCKLKTEPQRQSAQLKFCERPKRLTEPRASTGTAELEKSDSGGQVPTTESARKTGPDEVIGGFLLRGKLCSSGWKSRSRCVNIFNFETCHFKYMAFQGCLKISLKKKKR